jgi:cytochrome c oxidase cbb3-type subunit 3
MNRSTVRTIAAALVLGVAAAGPFLFSKATGGPKGDAAAGKALFLRNCVACHKADGTGGVKLTGNATPNWKDAKTWADPRRAKEDYFRECITQGRIKSGMVAWGKQLKPAEIDHLIAHIRSLDPTRK